MRAFRSLFGFGIGTSCSLLLCGSAFGAATQANVATEAPRTLRSCGAVYASPIASSGDPVKPRSCPQPTSRTYSPKFQTIGHEILRSESEACFVPDAAFQLLDTLIDQGQQRYKATSTGAVDWKGTAVPFFKSMGETLLGEGYQLYIPTETLGDALEVRQLSNGGKHIADCDTASLVYMSTAEVLGLPVSMVEITLGSGAGHNYLRWVSSSGEGMDWDTNGREQCVTPTGIPAWQGRTMTRTEVLGYTRAIRGLKNQSLGQNAAALDDYRSSASMYARAPFAHNNLAWLLATRQEFDQPAHAREAIGSAMSAISIERSANNLDTLACSYARAGDYGSAVATAKEVITLAPSSSDFKQRLEWFQAAAPRNCVGVD